MNGQLFNSSGSANCTPTPPSNNSYPASLSSQSSRDASPSHVPRTGPNGPLPPLYRNPPYGQQNAPYSQHHQSPQSGYQADPKQLITARSPWSDSNPITTDRPAQFCSTGSAMPDPIHLSSTTSSVIRPPTSTANVKSGQVFDQQSGFNPGLANHSFSTSNYNSTSPPAFNSTSGYGQVNFVPKPIDSSSPGRLDSHLDNNQFNSVSSYRADSLRNSTDELSTSKSVVGEVSVLQQQQNPVTSSAQFSSSMSLHRLNSSTPPVSQATSSFSPQGHFDAFRPQNDTRSQPTGSSPLPPQALQNNKSQDLNRSSPYGHAQKMPGDGLNNAPDADVSSRQDNLFPTVGKSYQVTGMQNANKPSNTLQNDDDSSRDQLPSYLQTTVAGGDVPQGPALGNNTEAKSNQIDSKGSQNSSTTQQLPAANPPFPQSNVPPKFPIHPAQNPTAMSTNQPNLPAFSQSNYVAPNSSSSFPNQGQFSAPKQVGNHVSSSPSAGQVNARPHQMPATGQPPPSVDSSRPLPLGANVATPTSVANYPPSTNSNNFPPPTNAIKFPPSAHSSNFPSSSNATSFAPSTNSTSFPPSRNNSNFPPNSNNLPPSRNTNANTFPPSASATNFPPSSSATNFPPSSNATNFPPSSSATNFSPSTNATNFPPSTNTSNFPPSASATNFPPSRSATNFPPSTHSASFPSMASVAPQQQFGAQPVMSQPRATLPSFQNQFQNRYPPAPGTLMQPNQQPFSATQQPNKFGASPSLYNQQAANLAGPFQNQRMLPPMRQPQPAMMDGLTNQFRSASITQDGYNRLWGMDTLDLLKTRDILSKDKSEAPTIRLNPEMFEAANCSPELFRCTLAKIPESKSLLEKSRLPLGVLIHPFKDLNQLSVIQCTTIVRCRTCRTYINPFVYFVDNKRWKCNLCFRVNELPDEFQFDPLTKTYGDPSRRPEIRSATIEFIAPSEYMVRPPQPAVYLFLFDVSRLGAECGYLSIACQTLLELLDNLPGDARTTVGFITYDSSVHFYSLAEGLSRPHQMTVVDIEDMFLPCPDNLLVNLNESIDLVKDLLTQLPTQYAESYDTESALGAALQAAYKLLAPTGGRATVFQARLPSIGPGALASREDPSQRAGDSVPHLNPSTDFYKKLALDCSGQQVAVDLFFVNSQYVDIATLSGVSRFSGGCIHHFPLFRAADLMQVKMLKKCFNRYLSRKIGFESVMRLRCTRGLSVHTFHGNFFVRSTDLLSLPNVNPDAGFGMQVSIDENLSELQTVCFQAALLYTSSKGERRIRVHTLCLPIANSLSDVLNSADQLCIIGLLSKMAVDRSMESSISDAREAFVNVTADILSSYRLTQSSPPHGSLLASYTLRLIPLYILALLKFVAFRIGQSTRLDDRVFAMCQLKSLPLAQLLQLIYPDLYPIHDLEKHPVKEMGPEKEKVHDPPRLHLSAERVDSQGIYLLDNGCSLTVYVGHNCSPHLCQTLFGSHNFSALPHDSFDLPELDTPESDRLFTFIHHLCTEKPYVPCIQVIRDDSHHRMRFLEQLVEDKNEAGTSYYEFLQRIKQLGK